MSTPDNNERIPDVILRDVFAMILLHRSPPTVGEQMYPESEDRRKAFAERIYKMADAMLEARKL